MNKYYVSYYLPTKNGDFKKNPTPNFVQAHAPADIAKKFVQVSKKLGMQCYEYQKITAEMRARGVLDEILKGRMLRPSKYDRDLKPVGCIQILNEKKENTYYMVW